MRATGQYGTARRMRPVLSRVPQFCRHHHPFRVMRAPIVPHYLRADAGVTGTSANERTPAVSIWDFFVWFFWFYIAISCVWIFITVIIDVFRDDTLNGWAKALWVLFLVLLPFLAAFIYLIARGQSMSARQREASQYTSADTRSVAGSAPSAASEIESAKRLLDSGAVTSAEYEVLKANALGARA